MYEFSHTFNISFDEVNYSPSDALLKAETKVVESSICRRSFDSAINIEDYFFICTQGNLGTGPCSVRFLFKLFLTLGKNCFF